MTRGNEPRQKADILNAVFALLLVLFAILRRYYLTDDVARHERFMEAVHALTGSYLPFYQTTTYLAGALQIAAYLTIASTLLAAARNRTIRPKDYTRYLAGMAVLGALAVTADYWHYLLAAAAMLASDIRIAKEENAIAWLSKIGRYALPATLAIALIPTIAYPLLVDVHLGSSVWTHYKKVQTIYETGLPIGTDSFPDKRFTAYPPLSHYMFAAAQYATGLSFAETLRLLYIVLGIATLTGTYILAKNGGGPWLAALMLLYFGLMSKFATASAYGNYAQLASNIFTIASLHFLLAYNRNGMGKDLDRCAYSLALAVLTHWLPAIVLTPAYATYLVARKKKAGKILGFFAKAYTPITAYFLVLTLKGILHPQSLLWAAGTSSPNQSFALIDALLPISGVGPAYYATFGLGLLGITMAYRRKELLPMAIAFATVLGSYLLLSNYLTFFYPYRLTYYASFFFSFFIAYGTTRTAQSNGKGRMVLLAALAVTVSAGALLQLNHLNTLAGMEQPLSKADIAAMMWIKENLNGGDIVATDAMRAENLYAYTEAGLAQPPEAADLFEGKATTPMFAYLTTSGSSCDFPCTDAIQLNKDQELADRWKKLDPTRTGEALGKAHALLLNESGTIIYGANQKD